MVTDEDLETDYNDEIERNQIQDYKAGNRRFPNSNNILKLLGYLLQPQTQGYEQINNDMSFTQLDYFGVQKTENTSHLINFCTLMGFSRASYLARGDLATSLIASRSQGAKSMEMFTSISTTQKQEFLDKTEKKTAWNIFGSGKKKEEDKGG